MKRITFEWNDPYGGTHIYSREMRPSDTDDSIQAEFEYWLRFISLDDENAEGAWYVDDEAESGQE